MSRRAVDVLSGLVKGKSSIWLAAALTIVFALTRLPYLLPMNFSAAYALAFCAGVYFPRRLAWWLPLGILLVTDILLNVFYYHVPALGPSMLANYLSYAGIIWLGASVKFTAPVRIGDTVTTETEIVEMKADKQLIRVRCVARGRDGAVVMEGDSTVKCLKEARRA